MLLLAKGKVKDSLKAIGCRTFVVHAPADEVSAMVTHIHARHQHPGEDREETYARALARVAWSYPFNRWGTTLWTVAVILLALFALVGTANAQSTQVQITGNATLATGQQAVTASPVALPSAKAKRVCVKALKANSINIYIGASGVTTATGMELAPGEAACFPITNVNSVYVVAAAGGANVSWLSTN